MADMLMLAQMGLNIAGGWANYRSAKASWKLETKTAELRAKQEQIAADAEYKITKAFQGYRNTVTALSAAQAENDITVNRIAVYGASTDEDQDIQIQAMKDQGAAAVASSGQRGNSVTLAMRDLQASAARASFNRVENLKAQYLSFAHDRSAVRKAAILSKDITVHSKSTIVKPTALPGPSSTAAILGIATDMLDTWDSYQAPGEHLSDILSRPLSFGK